MSWGEGEEERQWSCGKPGSVNLQKMSSIVEPCLSQSPIKVVIAVNRMLKPEKWQATFDSDGKVYGFQKALKLICLGGVDPSIRPEVWEFLLGCYAPSSTAEYRRQLRTARRERYRDLIKQCQMMHSSIGTGSLAYVVGSKVMDMRTSSKDEARREAKEESRKASTDNTNNLENHCNWNNNCTDTSYECQRESSSNSADNVSVRGSTDSGAYDSSFYIPTSGPCNCSSPKIGGEADGSQYVPEDCFDFPHLPVTDLFEKSGENTKSCELHDNTLSTEHKLRFEDGRMHSFQINNNVDLIIESNGSPSGNVSLLNDSEIEMVCPDAHESIVVSNNLLNKTEMINRLRISDVPETAMINSTSQRGQAGEDRVSEWLWTLHRIVVDVVRTDSHLEFYEDTRNLARMSDILAVYAWVDPATGYCQGMSDLLSPFVVLFEDNADAFWCFEMLLRRMRENFQMEGPTGVMKQLQSLWHILELTDREMFAHLTHIGAESLHFAFRMLLVLFRRELSFNEALSMWEMIWAADFDESLSYDLEEHCLEALVVQLPRDSGVEVREESTGNGHGIVKGSQSNHGIVDRFMLDNTALKSVSSHPFCGLTRNFWSKSDHMQICTLVSSTRNGDNVLPVFCVAAILIRNRQKIIRETHSFDDIIKIFNDNMLKINVKRCVRTAIKIRKKYLYKLIKRKSPAAQNKE
ncbi:uncharacterized protein LOC126701507 isoform X1 [Quercus robur]|uniref:uncharacterized protein LOC126701507 isoform X1 n=1 Tax=Quercus robur TaxID=38942 RepID=UPI002163EC1E|nr:uncharacterized protein LOC126701507 isoform X1 [Quercus robur]XP_050255599.1 uncharacterized protein LOC126701507 isoform X1 [Quercus robur]XP_050255600.1 uncharacterized protein LOC126701507 isoform X1 [Quercus robur]